MIKLVVACSVSTKILAICRYSNCYKLFGLLCLELYLCCKIMDYAKMVRSLFLLNH